LAQNDDLKFFDKKLNSFVVKMKGQPTL